MLHNLLILLAYCKALIRIPYEDNGDLKSYNEVKISIDRQHYVLKRMLVEGVISKKTYQQAKQYTIYDHLLTKPQ